jgi:beta-phosphoglucomutase-like phosphatase (HAD superfamily)
VARRRPASGIATSGREVTARPALEMLASTPMVTRDQVAWAKPDPDLFLAAADSGIDHVQQVGGRFARRAGLVQGVLA